MPPPTPPIPLKDHCSVIFDNVLYVYSPQGFITLPLKDGAKWSEEKNGVSVTGAACVKGGVDGDNSKTALYVVGGTSDQDSSDYTGLQRYSFQDKSWETIEPVVHVTKHRQNHGVTYINASSTLLVYGGSQDGDTGPSTQTFLMDTFPPYRVQAYNSAAPPVVKPFVFPWNDNKALVLGGSDTNQNLFTFDPTNAWQDLGLALPTPLPGPPNAQAAVLTLGDGSRILQTFKLDETPIQVTTNVLLNPGGAPGAFNQTVGESTSTSGRMKRQFLFNYPSYNQSSSPDTTRTGFSIAQGDDGLLAFVGGNDESSVGFFNQTGNGWVQANAVLGDTQSTTSSRPTSSPTSSIPTSSPTPAAPASSGSSKHSLVILGGVLGGVCGLAAILIILLLILRNIRRNKRKEQQRDRESPTEDGKTSTDFNFEQVGPQPLARQGQAMGRSPVISTVGPPAETGKSTMLAPRPTNTNLIRRVSSERISKAEPVYDGRPSFTQGRVRRDKSPLTISKPMNPDLGHYNVRPSIDLGYATPASPVNATAMVTSVPMVQRNRSQRKTDEAWAKYFAGEKVDPSSTYIGHGRNKSKDSQGGFWPGPGATPKSTGTPKFAFRGSDGRPIQQRTVVPASPALVRGSSGAKGKTGHISSADSMSSDGDYEDRALDGAFSSGIPDSVQDNWSPVGSENRNTQNTQELMALPTTSSMKTSNSSGTGGSSIPSFPMPTPTGRSALMNVENVQGPARNLASRQPRENSDYFGPGPGRDGLPTNSDMSWLNLGTPGGQSQNR